MLKSYFKIALRTLRRRKGCALINVGGLAVGLAGFLLMTLYVGHELTFDRFHAEADRTYRLVQETSTGSSAQTAGAHAALLAERAPGVEATVRLAPWERTITVPGTEATTQTAFPEPDFLYADPAFFKVFSFPLAQGDPATALATPGTAVLTKATAQKYFGQADPMGKTILMYDEYSEPNQIPLTVTGVLADAPGRSHLALSALSSTATMEQQYGPLNGLNWPGLYTYALLADDADPGIAAQRATETLAERLPGDRAEAPALRLQPLTAVYLNPLDEGEWRAGGSKAVVYGLAGVALIVLLLACINFTNLATARATTRIKEVGVRRVVGAHRSQLASQFLLDSFLLTGLALAIAVWLVRMGLPLVSAAAGRDLASVAGPGLAVPLALLGLAALTGLAAGTYPAMLIARQPPTLALRGMAQVPREAARMRAGLVVFQFGVSIALVTVTLGVFQQLDYVRTLRLGFDQERVLTVQASGARRNFEPLREAFAAQPGVVAVSATNGVPGVQDFQTSMMVQREGSSAAGVPIHTQGVGLGFFDLMNVRFVAGRFSTSGASAGQPAEGSGSAVVPERPIVLNETAAASLGWSAEEAVGQRVRIVQPGNETNNPGLAGAVVGVVADFHHSSTRTRIPASAYYPAQSADVPGLYVISHVLVKLAPGSAAERIAGLEAAWRRVLPDHPFEAAFLDAQVQAQYDADRRLGRAVALFAAFAVLIACLGLFGLAAFAAERRRKEIGIRKVLGASVASVVALLSKDFAKLVGVAFVVASPIAYFTMQRWLDGFAYRVDLSPWLFLGAGVAALGVALLTVSYQAARAALADPVEALRDE